MSFAASAVKTIPLWNQFDIALRRSRYEELVTFAEEHDGLFTFEQARVAVSPTRPGPTRAP